MSHKLVSHVADRVVLHIHCADISSLLLWLLPVTTSVTESNSQICNMAEWRRPPVRVRTDSQQSEPDDGSTAAMNFLTPTKLRSPNFSNDQEQAEYLDIRRSLEKLRGREVSRATTRGIGKPLERSELKSPFKPMILRRPRNIPSSYPFDLSPGNGEDFRRSKQVFHSQDLSSRYDWGEVDQQDSGRLEDSRKVATSSPHLDQPFLEYPVPDSSGCLAPEKPGYQNTNFRGKSASPSRYDNGQSPNKGDNNPAAENKILQPASGGVHNWAQSSLEAGSASRSPKNSLSPSLFRRNPEISVSPFTEPPAGSTVDRYKYSPGSAVPLGSSGDNHGGHKSGYYPRMASDPESMKGKDSEEDTTDSDDSSDSDSSNDGKDAGRKIIRSKRSRGDSPDPQMVSTVQ